MRTIFLTLLTLFVFAGTSAWAQPAPEGGADAPDELMPVETPDEEEEVVEAAAVVLTGPPAELAAILTRLEKEPALLALGSEAETELLRLSQGPNGLVEAVYDLGVFYLRINQLDKAFAQFQETLARDPNFSEAVAQLGVIAALRNEPEKATALIDQALAMDKYCAPARNYLSHKALQDGNLEEVIKHCRISLLGDPDNMNAYLNMAIALYRKGQFDVGELVCQSALRIDANNAPILNLLGLIHLKNDDVKGAITMLQAAVTADPEFMDARKNLAAVTLNFKDFGMAVKQLEAVLEREPENQEFRISYAVALRGMERFDEAKVALDRVLAKNPGHDQAQYNLCILLHEYLQDYAGALKVCSGFQVRIDKKHPKFQEMKLRVKGIQETIKIMEEMKQLQQEQPPAEEKAPEGEAAPPAEEKAPEGEAAPPAEEKAPEGEKKEGE